ncbi:MAG: DUF1501 domain-containing protein [Minicystis sp.]
MSNISRRSLLRGLLAGGALAGASSVLPRSAAASGPLSITPTFGGPFKILEIYLDGGADPWMHFYQTAWGPYTTWINNTGSTVGLNHITPTTWSTIFQTAAGGPGPHPSWVPTAPTGAGNSIVFGYDVAGHAVKWGPALKPLFVNGLQSFTRMIMVGHNFFPHEGAIPLAITGTGLGRTIACSLGAPINRVRPSGAAPVSFVIPIRPSGISGSTMASVAATGFHGAQNTPVIIPVGASTSIASRLNRDVATGSTVTRSAGDPLRTWYNNEYRGMLYRGGRVRSRGYDAYEGALTTLEGFAGVRTRITGINFNPTSNDVYGNSTATAIKAAFQLLTPGAGARHVTVVDSDWDTHNNGIGGLDATSYAVYNTRKVFTIAHAIADAYASGVFNPATTMIYIHSEFGRFHEGTNGTQHGPHAYPVLVMGGPVNSGWFPSSALVGATVDFTVPTPPPMDDPNAPYLDTTLDAYSVPMTYGITDVRAAVALAAGIDPWHTDMYVESNDWIGDQINAAGGATSASLPVLASNILGA